MVSPYISRHFFPVVEARDWLSCCSLEHADWFHSARWPPLICTHQVETTSPYVSTAPTLIGCLSRAVLNTVGAATCHSQGRGVGAFLALQTFTNFCCNNFFFFCNGPPSVRFVILILRFYGVSLRGDSDAIVISND